MKKQILYMLITFSLLNNYCINLQSQTFLGLQHSNYGGIHQTNLNPASIVNSRHKMHINAFTFGTGFNNDYLSLNMPFSLLNLITGNVPAQFKNPNGSVKFDENWLKENINGKSKNVNIYLQTRAPGYMQQIGKGFAFGFQYKNTLSFQVNDFAEPLARLARHGVDSSNGSVTYSGPNQFSVGQNFGDNAFTVNINAYGEFGITLAKTIVNNETMVIKAGITPKLLMGYATGYVKNKGVSFRATGSDSIIFNKTDIEYGYTDPSYFENINAVNFDVLSSKLQGTGFGYDIGGTFELKAKEDSKTQNKKNQYIFRAGLSLLDGGSITYKNNLKNTRITNGATDKVLKIDTNFINAMSNGQEAGIRFADSALRTVFQIDSFDSQIVTAMPSTINLQFDYNVFKFFYVGANWSQDLRGKKTVGVRKASYLMLIPRIETKLFELALPIGLMNDYRNGRIGVYCRVGPVFVGSDNLIGQLKGKNIYGSDLYIGISAGITGKKKKD
jgi:hypothetical protein